MDYKKSMNVKLGICEKGSLRTYPINNFDISCDISKMSRPPLRAEILVEQEAMVFSLKNTLARLIGLNWAVGLIPDGGTAVEIGCDYGDGLERMRHSGAARIIGIDPYRSQNWDCWFDAPQEEMDARYQMARNRFRGDKRVYIAHITSDEYFEGLRTTADWWFIDGDHREESCYRDICNCFERTTVGGHVCIDDVDCKTWQEGINAAIDRFMADRAEGEAEIVWRRSSPAVIRRLK